MRSFVHHRPDTVEAACTLLAGYQGRARANAGGSDLLGVLKDDLHADYPDAVVDLKGIPGLDGIRADAVGGIAIGASVRLATLARSPMVEAVAPVLTEAARAVATPQIRNVATVGGNLCQEVRCWYYRYPRHLGGPIICRRKGGRRCPAVKGDHRYHAVVGGHGCFAVGPSDLAVALAALDATAIIVGPGGERSTAVVDLYTPLRLELDVGELITAVHVPPPPTGRRQEFTKFTLRKSVDFAVVSLATSVSTERGRCKEVRIALGGIAPAPLRATAAEELLRGATIDEASVGHAAETALAGAKPLRGSAYKVQIARTLIRRALLSTLNPADDRENSPAL